MDEDLGGLQSTGSLRIGQTETEHTCMKMKKREEVFVEEKNMNCLREWYICII